MRLTEPSTSALKRLGPRKSSLQFRQRMKKPLALKLTIFSKRILKTEEQWVQRQLKNEFKSKVV